MFKNLLHFKTFIIVIYSNFFLSSFLTKYILLSKANFAGIKRLNMKSSNIRQQTRKKHMNYVSA